MSDGIKRRDFLKVLGVTGAGASMVGCSTEEVEKLIPYVVPPDETTPGIATWYTSVCQGCSAGCGIWVRTREGRAVKVEGNAKHPVSQGNLCARGHASLQGLYDPDRFPGPLIREGGELRQAGWDEAEALLAERMGSASGDLLFLTGHVGDSFGELVENFLAAVGGSRVEYQGLAEASLREATRIAFGQNVVPSFDFGAARFILSFGADFLETWLSPVAHARGFSAATSQAGGGKAPFVVASPRLSLTGQNADEWIPIRPGSEAGVALALARILADNGADPGPYRGVLSAYEPRSAASEAGVSVDVLEELAERLATEGPSLVVGPGVGGQHRNATAANLAVMILNAMAGNVGRTVRLDGPDLQAPSRPYGEIEAAIRAMAAGSVGVAMVHGTNPAYSLPPGSGFREAFGAVPFKVAFASSPDETAALADLILPDRHFLEAWGDSNPRPGVFALQQPTMQPIPHFDSKQTGDVLLSVAGRLGHDLGAATFYDYLRQRWERVHALVPAAPGGDAPGSGTFDEFWREALRRGVVEAGQQATDVSATLRSPDAALTFDPPALDGEGLEFTLLVYPSPRFGDGSDARSPWLLELPDPVSKITWHSWVEIHPAAAERLGVRDGDVVRVSSPHGELEVPVWTYPGIREDTVAIPMGLGHEDLGRFATGKGVNPVGLLPALAEQPSGAMVHLATRVSVEPTGVRRRLATVEGSSDQSDRPIALAAAVESLRGGEPDIAVAPGAEGHDPTARAEEIVRERAASIQADTAHAAPEEGGHGELQELQEVGGFVPVPTDGEPQDYPLPGARYGDYANPEETPRWAMAIDLDKCTGCSACITACQAENNVPWVGEEQILDGRDMHWIRLERYYEHVDAHQAGTLDIRHLPMLCQHCGNAPCEPVCPVFAAYHTPDGINGQVYNRCVGTRYCANNCPYKVRVFNWYTYTDLPEPMNWQYNPDVTVRENGVMEKCTFCIQRVREAQHHAAMEGRPIMDGEVVPACQQTCPAEAIVFGNVRDPGARVHRIQESERGYRILDEAINTQPAITYQKKVTFHAVESGEH